MGDIPSLAIDNKGVWQGIQLPVFLQKSMRKIPGMVRHYSASSSILFLLAAGG